MHLERENGRPIWSFVAVSRESPKKRVATYRGVQVACKRRAGRLEAQDRHSAKMLLPEPGEIVEVRCVDYEETNPGTP
jgi:hypothetical protein